MMGGLVNGITKEECLQIVDADIISVCSITCCSLRIRGQDRWLVVAWISDEPARNYLKGLVESRIGRFRWAAGFAQCPKCGGEVIEPMDLVQPLVMTVRGELY